MNPANRAIFRAKSVSLADTLRMEAVEVVSAALRLAVEYAPKAGIDLKGMHSLLDDNAAQAAIEGTSPRRQVGGTEWEAGQ
jgi:hypothetical protein